LLKKQVLLLLFFCILVSPATAIIDEAVNKSIDAGSSMIKKGIDSWEIGLGDDMYKAGSAFQNNTSSTNSSVSNLIFMMVTFPYDPFQDSWVLSTRNMTAFIFLFLALLYIFTGGAYVLLHTFFPSHAINLDWLGGFSYQSFSFREYLKTLIYGVLILVGAYTIVYLILVLNQVLTSMITLTVLDSIAPTTDNAFLYLMMGFIYFMLSVFMAWRLLVIGLMTAFALVVGGLYLFQPLRGIMTQVFYYFCIMVFMQFILVSIASGGVMIIQNLPLAKNTYVFYYALGLLLFFVSLLLILGPVTIMRLTKSTAKGVMIAL
jgi:hypothetical protein